MLFSALFGDAMGRDIVPAVYPQPEHEATARYVRVFLRALGVPSPDQIGCRRSDGTRSRHGVGLRCVPNPLFPLP